MEQFTSLIQLVTAINCAFIVVSFLKRVYDMFFNVQQMDSIYFNPLNQSINLCQGSLDNLNPPSTKEWTVFRRKVSRLKERLDVDRLQLSAAKATIIAEAESICQVSGFKSFFLFISIYCFCDLLLIGLISNCSWVGLKVIQLVYNILCFVFCIYFTYVIHTRKWIGKHSTQCYNNSILCVAVCLFFSIGLSALCELMGLRDGMIPNNVILLSSALSLALPFYPIIFTFYYFLDQKDKIYRRAAVMTKDIGTSLTMVLNDKTSLENTYYDMTQEDDIKWGG